MSSCIICKLPRERLKLIEKMLVDKISYQSIEDALKEFGTPISKTSIGRHKSKHMDLPQEPAKPTTLELVGAIGETPDLKGVPVDSSTMESCRKKAQQTDLLKTAILERRASQLMLEKIVQHQLSIVEDMQARYMQGNSEYPRDQITGLKSVMDLIQKLPAYTDFDIRRENKNVDQAVRRGEGNTTKDDDIDDLLEGLI